MFALWLLSGTLIAPNLVFGATDSFCYDNCRCCLDEVCQKGIYNWPNACTIGCIDGHRGGRCYELCQYTNCKTCGEHTGDKTCTACYDGYYLGTNKDCTLQCPSNCKSCTSNTRCTECKDDFYDKDGSTTCRYVICPVNCKCSLRSCISCKPGFYNTSSLCTSTCPRNCDTCALKDKCDECKNGFYNGYEYDNNKSLQLNNCTYNCRDTCTQCQSHNNCSECVNGKHGLACQVDCSFGCKGMKCLIESGVCECLTNFSGDKCTECIHGQYGQFCNQTCPANCKNKACEKTSGYCVNGCISETITGNTCNTCRSGMYGELCDKNCSENCYGIFCERASGKCLGICKVNFDGVFCDACVHGKYGVNCEHSCPINCRDGICEKNEGNCYTCAGNYHGEKCITCKPGYFGPNCEEICSHRCAMTTCNRHTGACVSGCMNGYSGDRCCVESEYCMNCSSNTECSRCRIGFFQNTCKERCPSDCLEKCDFLTGECYDCKNNHFGGFCNFICSDQCNVSLKTETRCAKSDGKCTDGCQDGYTGPACNVPCSNLCIGNVCKQDTGICVHGCDDQHDDDVCDRSIDSYTDDDVEISVTAAVLGSLLALSLCINISGVLYILLKHRKRGSRKDMRGQSLEVAYENTMASSHGHQTRTTENELNTTSAKKTNVYEVISSANDVSEHDYQQLSPIATTAVQETKY